MEPTSCRSTNCEATERDSDMAAPDRQSHGQATRPAARHGVGRWQAWLLATVAALACPAYAQPAGWSGCDLGDVRIEAGFPGGRADGCFRQTADDVAVLVMPESARINPSPWYAFRIASDAARQLNVTLVYGEGKHRYWPKLSHDGKTWQRLAEEQVHVAADGATATLEIDTGPQPVWIAAQELWPSQRYTDWLARLSGQADVSVSLLGRSVMQQPISVLRTATAKTQAGSVVLVGRQHPPEVPGAFALQPFVETLLDDSELSRRFRQQFGLVVVPELNPDGVERGNWRQNAGGVDINRDWGPFTQPETRLMRDLLASLNRKQATRPRVFLDFHATREDVFYTRPDQDPVDPPLFERRWLGRLQERMPDYVVNRKPGHQVGYPTAKTWVNETYGIPAVTFEIGDETPRELITTLARQAALAMMETLLETPASLAATGGDAGLAAVPAGRGRFTFDGWSGPPILVWYQRPQVVTPQTPVLFVMHGVKRDAERYRDEWSAMADRGGFILVVPEFNDRQFPGAAGYNLGFVQDGAGRPRPRDKWSFSAIEPLFDAIRRMTGTTVDRYGLYGHSAGAQFVHRYVMFMPEARVGQAIVANAGWYTMPQKDVGFPYGLKGSGVSDDGLREALQRRMTILLGTRDTDEQHPNLRRTPEAMAQGANRVARGERFFDAAAAAARDLKVPFAWKLQQVEGVTHDNGGMATAAASLFVGQEIRPVAAD